jgi:hypothetical protein
MVFNFIVTSRIAEFDAMAGVADSPSNFWSALPTILWVLFAASLLWIFRARVEDLCASLIWRIRSGTPFKLGTLELGAISVSARGDILGGQGRIQSSKDTGRREQDRNRHYIPNRGIFLVHRLVTSRRAGQLYDVEIYAIPHKDSTLACVARVEYFFGSYWGNNIFTTQDRARGFSISTTAYGPFVATAEIVFTDGTSAMVWRYVDFEMGASGSQPLGTSSSSPDV